MMPERRPPQELIFELMKGASFNNFDGEAVVSSLLENRELWIGCVAGRFDGFFELIPLRDLPEGWNVDTVYISCPRDRVQDLVALVRTWRPDEVGILSDDDASEKMGVSVNSLKEEVDFTRPCRVIRVWWD